MQGQRTLPKEQKNKTASFVHWFYTEILGFPPDASQYAKHSSKKNPRALVHLFVAPEDGVAVYEPSEVGELVWYLIDNGVNVSDIFVVTLPGLMYNYKYRIKSDACASELQRTIEYLKSRNGNGSQQSNFNVLEGWGL